MTEKLSRCRDAHVKMSIGSSAIDHVRICVGWIGGLVVQMMVELLGQFITNRS